MLQILLNKFGQSFLNWSGCPYFFNTLRAHFLNAIISAFFKTENFAKNAATA